MGGKVISEAPGHPGGTLGQTLKWAFGSKASSLPLVVGQASVSLGNAPEFPQILSMIITKKGIQEVGLLVVLGPSSSAPLYQASHLLAGAGPWCTGPVHWPAYLW
jgi:hypothetical protein